MQAKKIPAPIIDANTLWSMADDQFNEWRQVNDYPRIIQSCKDNLDCFEDWMNDQKVDDQILIKYSPSAFLKEDETLYVYTLIGNDNKEIMTQEYRKYEVGEQKNIHYSVKERADYLTYPFWYKKKFKKRADLPSLRERTGRSTVLSTGLELLDLGNCTVNGLFIKDRKLDFVNLSDLSLINCNTNHLAKLWFCVAINLSVQGGFTFVSAYKSDFSIGPSPQKNSLNLSDGYYQDWHFDDCELRLVATNSTLRRWKFKGDEFYATLTNTDLNESVFETLPIKYPTEMNRAKRFHATVKLLYSQLGKKYEASKHYYLEKTFERKSFLHVKENYRDEYYRDTSDYGKAKAIIKYRWFYLESWINNIVWGYGEKPIRPLIISILIIFLCALCYCLFTSKCSQTHLDFWKSLYYSLVTFTTLGYGDITQPDISFKVLSGFEALAGMTFWALVISGYTNKAKAY